ncbi:hypothetical protein [Francisella philomiragia]|uniref:Uncharacterized protein n=1 Tax=Francisella philomiragia TaxID=28110 RepID=A0A0B6D5U1_9GAMM|nr:hypothetical protein [Francisella philomiragia]AJI53023.1 hypothetical protein LA55_1235 [Francisella philomiragia]
MTYKEKITQINNKLELVDKQIDKLLAGDPVSSISSDGNSITYVKLQDLQNLKKLLINQKNQLRKRFTKQSSTFAKIVVVS